jgi:hypothetical protein
VRTERPVVATAAASTAVRRLLVGPVRRCTVLASFRRAVYLVVEPVASGPSSTAVGPGEPASVVALVTADGIAHPNAVQLALPSGELDLPALVRRRAGVIGDGGILLPALHVDVLRWWDPRPRLHPLTTTAAVGAADTTARQLVARSGPVPPALLGPLEAVVARLHVGDPAGALEAARRLIGAGPGLTPAGDDVLAGLVGCGLAVARALERPALGRAADLALFGAGISLEAQDRTTTISAALLRTAAAGAVAGPVATWLRALSRPAVLERASDEVLAIGATSGRDLLVGAVAAIHLVAARPAVPAFHPARSS